jgi:hypothetical protein
MREVPQVTVETGVSADYWNEWGTSAHYLNEGKPDKVFADIRDGPIRRYQERFGSDYADVVTNQNREAVSELDRLTDEVNQLPQRYETEPEETARTLKVHLNKVIRLIYGPDQEIWFPDVELLN